MEDGKNIIDAIEERLKQLEKEKDEIENLYGINEDVIKEFTNSKEKKEESLKKTQNRIGKSKSELFYDSKLPKLEITAKKEMKSFYKTPDTLQDSLKYEPNIKDLLDEEEFEPSFTNLNSLKTNPYVPKGSNISSYIDFLNEDYTANYIN